MVQAPVKLGLVGLSAGGSWASRAHLPYLKDNPHYKIVALQNSSKASAEKAAKEYGLDNVACYGDINSLLADPNVDMVAISVKVPDHLKLVEPTIKAKKNIFVEWPLAANLSEAQHMVSLVEQNNLKTLVGLQGRQNPAILKAKEMVDAGELGDILGTTMNASGSMFGPTVTHNHTYLLPIENGANLMTIPAGHAMDAMCFVLGELKDLQATLANNRPKLSMIDAKGQVIESLEKTSHDYIAFTGTLQRGGVASVVYQGGGDRKTGNNFFWEINGTKGSLVLEGNSGHIQINAPSIKFVRNEGDGKLVELDVPRPKESSYNVGQAWDALIGKGDGHVTTFADALVRHKMIDAIYRSHQKGTRESYL